MVRWAISFGDIALNILLAGSGNLIGGVLLMTLTHVIQVIGARQRG